MNENQTYKYTIVQNSALIELGSVVLGGNDALAFSELLNELSQKPMKSVVVDLHNVEMINSSGLGMLVGGLSNMRKKEIKLDLASVPEKVLGLLQMTHLDRVFRIFETTDEAVKSTV
jgi:anti-sigma B factor antagonist